MTNSSKKNQVVRLEYPNPEIALLTMQDEEHKNTFSDAWQHDINKAFNDIKTNPNVKVVITQGYGNYYSCGGTLKELKSLSKGEKTFADLIYYKLPLECSVPTIAAVQGHAIGGGLAFACIHDFIILSQGSIYSANFMKYGFTPGMLATYTIPKRFGDELGRRLLYTAHYFNSKELRELNCPLPMYPKKEVISEAIKLAGELCDKTLESLKLLKQHLTTDIRATLPDIVRREVAMHEATLQTPEVLQRIQDRFEES